MDCSALCAGFALPIEPDIGRDSFNPLHSMINARTTTD